MSTKTPAEAPEQLSLGVPAAEGEPDPAAPATPAVPVAAPKANADTLYLIDGSGFIFRAFYAIRTPMSSSDGTPTNAVFGFTRLLMAVLKQEDPEHVAVIFDPPGDTFRNDMYPEYKANRDDPPPEMVPQFPLCREVTRALNIPALEVEKYEADDIIGTLATKWAATGRKVVIVTADKDMMQLVTEDVTLWDGKEKRTDIAGVHARFGVPPEQVIDVLGLAGDSSDNIPGVPGIGEKTASTLLGKHGGTLESLLAAAPGIKGKRGQALVDHADTARLSAKLATIVTDAPIELDEAALLRKPPEPTVLRAFLEKHNFKTFMREFGLTARAGASIKVDRSKYRLVTTEEGLAEVVATVKAAGRMAFDLETTGLDTLSAQILGFAIAWAPNEAAYVPVAHAYTDVPAQLSLETVLGALKPLLEDPKFPIAGQHAKFEWQMMRKACDVDLQGIHDDSLLAAFLLEPDRKQFSLDSLAMDHLGHQMITFAEVTGTKKGPDDRFKTVPLAAATAYAGEDADLTLRLCDRYRPILKEQGLLKVYDEIELPLAPVLGRMEQWGIKIDPQLLHEQSARFAKSLEELEAQIHSEAGQAFNIASPKQLGEILFDKLGLEKGKKTKTGYSTSQDVLEKLSHDHAVPRLVLQWRQIAKLKNTYLDTLPKLINPVSGRVHSSFRQTGAATGRLSSSEPNLQNIPVRSHEGREIRRAFVAEPGWKLVSADYSQVELRLMAHLSEDPVMIDTFIKGTDVHRRTASEIFGVDLEAVTSEQRRQAKAINFGILYGMGPYRLSNELEISQTEAKEMIERYFKRYPKVSAYLEEMLETARKEGRVRTMLGRIRPLPDIHSKRFSARQHSERMATNTPIQGTAADLMKLAMIKLDRRISELGLKSRILLTVHDELVVEVPEAELDTVPDLVKHEMETVWPDLKVPLSVEVGVGDNWAAIH
ncbi:MAG: DNA polymerase I [Bradymonadia bacterium]